MRIFLNILIALLIMWVCITADLAPLYQLVIEAIALVLLMVARANYKKVIEFLTANSY